MSRKSRENFDAAEELITPVPQCWLCGRPVGEAVEFHHPVPKSRGGKIKQLVHAICHKTIHANFSNSDLEKRYSSREALLSHPEIGRFVIWIANKPPDFNAPTKDRR